MEAYHATEHSLWFDTAHSGGDFKLGCDSLQDRHSAHIVIIGGGLVGLLTAFEMCRRDGGIRCADDECSIVILEANQVGSGVTGNSTAKVSALHRIKYAPIEKIHGTETAEMFARMNLHGVEIFKQALEDLELKADVRDSYTYTVNEDSLEQLREEFEACLRAKLPVEWTTETDLPFPVKGAIKLSGQLQVDPVTFCRRLAKYLIEKHNVKIYENSRVTYFSEGVLQRHRVSTEEGEILCDNVVFATHLPISDRGMHFAYTYPSRSYCSAFQVKEGKDVPMGMYITSEQEHTRSIRSACDGKILIICGEGHLQGDGGDTTQRYKILHNFAQTNFPVEQCIANWSAHDFVPADQLPYVGFLHRLTKSLYIATGFAKWGFAMSAISGSIITNLFKNHPDPYYLTVSSTRFDPLKSAKGVAEEQAHVAKHFFPPRHLPNYDSIREVPIGEDCGALVRVQGKAYGVYKDKESKLHVVNPTCKHLGCTVTWNNAERCWDCPCHGSRYNCDGKVLAGPSCHDLEAKLSW
jgi:glycine/D-amino acid oxidase-like deaminating enzyme/nitrite reductase/ring-hydroxylating ferredoxin subunit